MKQFVSTAKYGDQHENAFPGLKKIDLEFRPKGKNPVDDVASGLFRGKEVAIDAGGTNSSWAMILDDLSTAYRLPLKEERDLLHFAEVSEAAAAYIEAPFGSYRLPNRLKVVQVMWDNSIRLYSVDSSHSTRALHRRGLGGPLGQKHPDGWTNPEAARAIAEYAIAKRGIPGVLTQMTPERFGRDHTDRNRRRAEAQVILKDLRRDGDQHYAGHPERVAALAGRFRDPGLEKIALASEVILATLWVIADYTPTQDDIDDFFPREGAYRRPGRDQAGLFRSNLAFHAKQQGHSLKDLRRAARAVRSIRLEGV